MVWHPNICQSFIIKLYKKRFLTLMIYIHINIYIYTYTHSLATLLGTPCLYRVGPPFAFRTALISCSLHQILTLLSECRSRNRDSSEQATFLQSSIVQFWWVCVNCILRVLFLSDRSSTRCGLLLLEPICFRVRRVVCSEMYSADLGCNEWLFELLLPFYHL